MDERKRWTIIIAVAVGAIAALWFLRSPSGTDAVEAIDNTASEITGKRAIDQAQPLRAELQQISESHQERLRGAGLEPTGADR